MESIVTYIQTVAGIFILEVIWLIPCVLLAFGMNWTVANLELGASNLIGGRAFMLLFGWLGTFIHECGHLLFCLIFRHKIGKVKLFTLNPEEQVRGYVNHTYDHNSFYQKLGNFFIGIGPVILSAIVVYLLLLTLLDFNLFATLDREKLAKMLSNGDLLGICKTFITALFDLLDRIIRLKNLTDWKFYLFIYLAMISGSAARLSPADFRHAWLGVIFLGTVLLLANLLLLWTGKFAAFLLSIGFIILIIFYLVLIFVMIFLLPIGLILNSFKQKIQV